MDWRVKNEEVHDQLGKRAYDQNWVSHDEKKEYVSQRGAMVSRRSNKELEKKSPMIEE
jgi:hypothetical protein